MRKECIECAGNPTNHFASYSAALMTNFMRPWNWYLEAMSRIVDPILFRVFNPRLPRIYENLAKLGLGYIHESSKKKDSWKIKCMWASAEKKGIKMRKYSLFKNSRGTYWAEHTEVTPMEPIGVPSVKKRVALFDTLPRPAGKDSKALSWMDDKGLMRKKMSASQIPVARGGVAMTISGGLKLFRNLDKPVITKPSQGSRSRHTTIHINTEEQFKRAFKSAKQLSPWVVVEEELKGMVFRGTIVDGKIVAVMRREPPHVVGDGMHPIKELVIETNKNPKRKGPIFHEIELGVDAEEDLSLQGLTWLSVPENGRVVTLGQKVGRTSGASTTDVTDIIHPENTRLLEKIYEIAKDPLIGVDFIMEDISKPWTEQKKSGVIELNSMPFIDLHHYPLFGEPRDVAGALWDAVFKP